MSITKDLNVFQVVTMAIFLVIGAVGIVLFATNKVTGGNTGFKGTVWGVLPKEAVDRALQTYIVRGVDPNFTYVEYPEAGFGQAILKAVAEGRGPDAIIFPDTMYFDQRNKLVTIPTETMSTKVFADTYIDAGNLFAVQGGTKAFPLVVDPLVMYYNKDMFTSAGILYPPTTWSELQGMTGKMVRKKDDGFIDRSFVALGEYVNINYAKNILYTLFAQAGVDIGYYDYGLGTYGSGFTKTNSTGAQDTNNVQALTQSVLAYYTGYANPTAPEYSWNRGLIASRDAFLAQKLAVYFGPASEVEYMKTRNPNLNFGIALVPQENENRKIVHGKTYALGFLITSQHLTDVYPEVTKYFMADGMVQELASALQVAPAKRSLVSTAAGAKDSISLAVVYESAKYAHAWPDPNPAGSDTILQTLIEAVTSGKQSVSDAIQDAATRMDGLYQSQ
jgi:ABC-type glycerol-3-phosphate transport system substrate-binding protein